MNADESDPFTPGANASQLLTNTWSEPSNDNEPPSRKQLPGEYDQTGESNQDDNLPPFDTSMVNNLPPTDLSALSRDDLEKLVRSQGDELMAANAEAQYFQKRWQDLHLSNEALGQESLTGDEQQLEDRLVQAVKEGYQGEMQRRDAIKLLDKLMNSSKELIASAPHFEPGVRAQYEVDCRAATDLIKGHGVAAIPLGTSLADAQIADVNLDLKAVILNVGKNQGAAEGMPFIIYQNDNPVGIVRVIFVRPLVSEALIQNLVNNVQLKKGDKAVVNSH